ncbi:MAG: polysaccharide pyruvyl transferase family protein [Clostridia bacterium]|nr:polysaccharide pyruvyl transferase family protein [Clostridia bacterium]
MKKIKIVTYCSWTSIGSVLQSLGLKKTLAVIGYQSSIWLNREDNAFAKTRVHSVKSFFKRSFEVVTHQQRQKTYQKRMDFISRNIDLEYYSTYSELEYMAAQNETDVILAGSDQIWHPDHCNPVFFLDFASNKKRVSYAASMGKTEIHPDKRALFGQLVNNFDSISVREEACVSAIRDFTDKDISVHIDPTFLVAADEWRKYEVAYMIRRPYILLYMLYWNKACKDKIKALKRKTGLPVYAISNGLSGVYADTVLYDVGVEEFLWLVDHAEYVVTSSFHGVAFSAIFNKKFAPIINPSVPSRIENLLRTLSLPVVDIEDLAAADVWNYATVNDLIAREKERSMEYLKKVLE